MGKNKMAAIALCMAAAICLAGCGSAAKDASAGKEASAQPQQPPASVSAEAQPSSGSDSADASSTAAILSADAQMGAVAPPAGGQADSGSDAGQDAGTSTVTSTATASIEEEPDTAAISLGVETTDSDASSAQSENTKTINSIIDVLEQLGVDEDEIATSSYDMYPNYDSSSDSQEITGYTVTTMLTISGQKVKEAGDIIDQCVSAGANTIGGVTYTCSNYDSLYEQALQQAVQACQEKGDVLAKAAGKSLGTVVSIKEGSQDEASQYQNVSSAVMEDSSASTDLMPGQLEIKATVTVSYQLQ